MKSILTPSLLLLGSTLVASAQGHILPNGIIFSGLSGSGVYMVDVMQGPSGDYTGFTLKPENSTLFSFDVVVDEGVRVFDVSQNSPLTFDAVQSANYSELTAPNSYTFANGSTFYLGFYTGYSPWDSKGNYTGIYSDPVFGWAQFRNANGAIQMLSSALEYGGGGIYTGTQTIVPVPEPGIAALSVLGVVTICSTRLRGTRKKF